MAIGRLGDGAIDDKATSGERGRKRDKHQYHFIILNYHGKY